MRRRTGRTDGSLTNSKKEASWGKVTPVLRPRFGEAAMALGRRVTEGGAPGERSCCPSLGPRTRRPGCLDGEGREGRPVKRGVRTGQQVWRHCCVWTLTSARVEVGSAMQDDKMQEQWRGVHLHRPRQEPAEKLHVPATDSGSGLPQVPPRLRAHAGLPAHGGQSLLPRGTARGPSPTAHSQGRLDLHV